MNLIHDLSMLKQAGPYIKKAKALLQGPSHRKKNVKLLKGLRNKLKKCLQERDGDEFFKGVVADAVSDIAKGVFDACLPVWERKLLELLPQSESMEAYEFYKDHFSLEECKHEIGEVGEHLQEMLEEVVSKAVKAEELASECCDVDSEKPAAAIATELSSQSMEQEESEESMEDEMKPETPMANRSSANKENGLEDLIFDGEGYVPIRRSGRARKTVNRLQVSFENDRKRQNKLGKEEPQLPFDVNQGKMKAGIRKKVKSKRKSSSVSKRGRKRRKVSTTPTASSEEHVCLAHELQELVADLETDHVGSYIRAHHVKEAYGRYHCLSKLPYSTCLQSVSCDATWELKCHTVEELEGLISALKDDCSKEHLNSDLVLELDKLLEFMNEQEEEMHRQQEREERRKEKLTVLQTLPRKRSTRIKQERERMRELKSHEKEKEEEQLRYECAQLLWNVHAEKRRSSLQQQWQKLRLDYEQKMLEQKEKKARSPQLSGKPSPVSGSVDSFHYSSFGNARAEMRLQQPARLAHPQDQQQRTLHGTAANEKLILQQARQKRPQMVVGREIYNTEQGLRRMVKPVPPRLASPYQVHYHATNGYLNDPNREFSSRMRYQGQVYNDLKQQEMRSAYDYPQGYARQMAPDYLRKAPQVSQDTQYQGRLVGRPSAENPYGVASHNRGRNHPVTYQQGTFHREAGSPTGARQGSSRPVPVSRYAAHDEYRTPRQVHPGTESSLRFNPVYPERSALEREVPFLANSYPLAENIPPGRESRSKEDRLLEFNLQKYNL